LVAVAAHLSTQAVAKVAQVVVPVAARALQTHFQQAALERRAKETQAAASRLTLAVPPAAVVAAAQAQ
jgi:hypothetical protein